MNQEQRGPWSLSKSPRNWQSSALEAWKPSFHGIASVVTGGGKTTFAQMCMQFFRQHYPAGRFVIVTPTLALLDQWYVSLREDLMLPVDSIALFSGEGRPDAYSDVNLMVINTARLHAAKMSAKYTSMLIVDECHHAASPANSQALNGNHEATLGISATPEREYDDLFNDVLIPALGPVIFRYDYRQALQDGVIVPFDLINVSTAMTSTEQHAYDRATADISRTSRKVQSGELGRDLLVRKLQRRARLAASSSQRIPVTIGLAEQHRGSRMIIFHESIQSAEQIWQILVQRGFNATIYHSRIRPELRRDNLRLYRRGVFDVLVTCRALDEGVNVPETDVAIVTSSTASLRQRIQRLGRVLRPAQGKLQARIYTIYVSKPEEDRLAVEACKLMDTGQITWMRSTLRSTNATTV